MEPEIAAFNKRPFLLNVYRISLAIVLLYLLAFWMDDAGSFRIGLISVGLGLFGIGYFLALRRKFVAASHIHVTVFFLVVSLNAMVTGGVAAPGLIWLMICPMVSFLTLSFRTAQVWLLVVLMTMLAFFIFDDRLPEMDITVLKPWYLAAGAMCCTSFLYLLMAFRAKVTNRTIELLRANQLLNERQSQLEQARAAEAERSRKLQYYLNQHLEISRMEEIHTGSFKFAAQAIQQFVIKSLQVDSVAIWYLHPDTGDLKLVGSQGRYADNKREISPLKKTCFPDAFEMLESGAIITSDNGLTASKQFADLMKRNATEPFAAIGCPFFIEGKFGGFFACRSTPRTWAEEDILFVRAVSDTLALAFKSHQRKMQQRLLEHKQREIEQVNESLEQKIADRTATLNHLNAKLAQIAYTNAHIIRGPICRLVGLSNLLKMIDDAGERKIVLGYVAASIDELDAITRKTSYELNAITGK